MPLLSRWLAAFACAVAWLTAAGSVGDVIAFGIHEHIAGDAGEGMEPSGMTDVHTAHHHCDLSMSPAAVATATHVTAPIAIPSAAVGSRERRPQSAPVAPLRPPRA
jgi:hypothetical protein